MSVTKWNQDDMKDNWNWICHENYFSFLLEFPEYEDKAIELEKQFGIYDNRDEIRLNRLESLIRIIEIKKSIHSSI